jgi:hypothetical protein
MQRRLIFVATVIFSAVVGCSSSDSKPAGSTDAAGTDSSTADGADAAFNPLAGCRANCTARAAAACPKDQTIPECEASCSSIESFGKFHGCIPEWTAFVQCEQSAPGFTCVDGYAKATGCGSADTAMSECYAKP